MGGFLCQYCLLNNSLFSLFSYIKSYIFWIVYFFLLIYLFLPMPITILIQFQLFTCNILIVRQVPTTIHLYQNLFGYSQKCLLHCKLWCLFTFPKSVRIKNGITLNLNDNFLKVCGFIISNLFIKECGKLFKKWLEKN